MGYSICVDNCEKTAVRKLFIGWYTPFINLFFDRKKAKEKGFADNGRNWQ